ncbi:MAG: long-chain-acyl-CoA synthetase [Gammaproteobacteria bacterium]|nr:long-chain-acyl-CoA synthetase [Gammaproteobacteria bacterium]
MSNSDTIVLTDVLKSVPGLIKRVPKIGKAAKVLNPKRTNYSMGAMIADVSAKHPNNVAVYQDNRKVTYAELNRQANQIAHYLVSIGVKKGDTVALSMQNRAEFLICVTGIAKAGGVAALLNTSQTSKVLTHSINLVNPVAAIIGEEQLASYKEVRNDLVVPKDKAMFVGDWDAFDNPGKAPRGYINLGAEMQDQPKTNPIATDAINKTDHLFYIYTSGTTGMPKASITNHERFLAAYGGGGIFANLSDKDILYATLPLYHATGLLVCWAGGVLNAGAAIVPARKFSASNFWVDVERYQCTAFGYVGELCRYLMNVPEKPDDVNNTIHTIIGNGLRPSIWPQFRKRFDIKNVVEFYASSEGNVAFFNLFNLESTVGFGGGNIALVKYDRDTESTVKDAKGFHIKADKGEPGLMLGKVTASTPFIGYTQKDKTEGALLRDVFKKGDCYFNTGDMLKNIGCMHYQFVDRLGDTFRWKGENVSTTEVENIMHGFPGFEDAVVYGVEVPDTNGRAGMVSLTPTAHAKDLKLDALLTYMKAEMPAYAVPLFIRIKPLMETTATFKYKKSDLKKDGYDPSKVSDTLYALLAGKYEEITPELFNEINAGKHRL